MKKLLLLSTAGAALVVFGAGPAAADPITAALAAVIGGGATAVAFAQVVVGLGLNLLAAAASKAFAPKRHLDVNFEASVGDDVPLTFVVGDYVTAGSRKYIGSWGPNTRYIVEVIEVSAIPQPGQPELWINDEPAEVLWGETATVTDRVVTGWTTTNPGTDHEHRRPVYTTTTTVLGHPLTNQKNGATGYRCWIHWVDGDQTTAHPYLTAVFGAHPDYPWTSAMIGKGKTYAIMTTQYDADTMTQAPTFLFKPRPLRLYDPRKDSSVGGSGAHRWGDSTTYEESRNNAVVAYNLARGIYYGTEWVFGGQNLPAWRLPLVDWVVAMNACDADITVGAGTEPAFRCGAEISVDMEPLTVIEQIGLAGSMRFSEVGGRLRPLVGLPGAPVFVFSDDDLVVTDGQDLRPFAPLSQTFNNGIATYPEPAQRWKPKTSPEVRLPNWLARDGQDLPMEVTFGAAPFGNQVQRLLRSHLYDAQRTVVHEVTLPPQAYGIEPLDLVTWNSARNGYTAKNFLVLAVSKLPGMNVRVAIRETNPSDYSWSPEFLQPSEVVPTVAAPKPRQVVSDFTATGVTISDTDSRARVSAIQVSCSGDLAGVDRIRVRVLPVASSSPVVDQTFPFDAPHVWLVTGVAPKTTYRVLVRPISGYAAGVWSEEITVTTPDLKVPASGLATDVLDLMEETAALAGVKPVSSLPATGAKPDQIVMLVPPGRLYRWTGTEWTTNLFAGVEPGSLDIAAFAANIRPPELFAALPTTGNTDGRTVYRTSDNTMWQRRAGAWVNINSAELIVGQLVAGQIAAGAIGAEQIAAKAVVASKLAIGDTSNIFPDPLLVDFPNGWVFATSADYNAGVATVAPSGITASPSENQIQMAVGGVAADGGPVSPVFSVEAGKDYFVSAFMGAYNNGGFTTNCTMRLRVRWYTGTDATGLISIATVAETTQSYGAALTPISGIVRAPANARSARVYFMRVGDAATDAYLFSGPVVRRANAGELTVDGSVTADHLAAGSVVADKLAANAVVASKIAAGAVTASKISVSSLSAVSGTLGTFVSGTAGGERTEITGNTIKVYDASNTLRVIIGELP